MRFVNEVWCMQRCLKGLRRFVSGQRTIRFITPTGTDYDLVVYDSSGTYVVGLFATSAEQTKEYTFSSGNYYIKVYSQSGCDTKNVYRLIIE